MRGVQMLTKRQKRKNMMKALIGMLFFFQLFYLFGCYKKNKELEKSAQNFLGSINTAPSVEVENGQSAVIKIHEGYLFIIPNKKDVFSGSYKVLFSKSGDFKKESKEVLRESYEDFAPPITVMGHMIRIVGESNKSITIKLNVFDESQIAISKFDGTDANTLNVSELEFIENPGIDEKASEEFSSELEKELKKRK